MENLPDDVAMLLSVVNMKLRDEYPDGLESLCEDMGIDRRELESKLAAGGFEYSRENNRFW